MYQNVLAVSAMKKIKLDDISENDDQGLNNTEVLPEASHLNLDPNAKKYPVIWKSSKS